MSTTKTKFVVVSLPRTGTMSLCQMAKNMGLEVSHAPGPAFEGMLNRTDFVADTPAFQPSLVQQLVDERPEVKFIYCERPRGAQGWVESMQKINLARNYNNMYQQNQDDPESLTRHNQVDFESLFEVLEGPFNPTSALTAYRKHRALIQEIVPADRLLVYSFDQGYGPLASFMDVNAPDESVPHLNTDTMFDKLT